MDVIPAEIDVLAKPVHQCGISDEQAIMTIKLCLRRVLTNDVAKCRERLVVAQPNSGRFFSKQAARAAGETKGRVSALERRLGWSLIYHFMLRNDLEPSISKP